MGTIPIQSTSGGKRIFLWLLCLALSLAPALTSASEQETDAIRKTVESFVRLNTTDLPGRVSLSVGAVDPRLRLPACSHMEVFVPAGSRLWGNATVGVRCPAPTPWTIYVPVTIRVVAQVAVAARPLPAGQTLGETDILMQEGDLSQLPPGIILDRLQIAGKTLISGIASGQAFRSDMLRAPQAIQQGQTVKIVAKGNGFQVSSEGKALANAAIGQVISVRTQSGQIINGIARPNGVVEVNY